VEELPSQDPSLAWLPSWIHRVGTPLWVSRPDRTIGFVNDQGQRLLELGVTECRGEPCYRVVAGADEAGRPFCSAHCPLLCATNRGDLLEPFTLQIGERERGVRQLRVQCVPLTAPDGSGPWIVHLAWDIGRELRMEEFLRKVARRTPASSLDERGRRLATLTAREREILAHLAADEDLPTIAANLYVSHATVRNHVQHILTKLDAHSTLEAVALLLLQRDRRRE
jgi:DNA-binding CsgD family transcriptional regulator